jgi:fructose-bisphosphate aldolase class II
MRQVVVDRYQAFGTAGQASRIRPISLEAMFQKYADGSLDQIVH